MIGLLVMMVTGYALFFGGASNLKSVVKAAKRHLSPFLDRGCSFKGKTISFRGRVLKSSTLPGDDNRLLIESDNRRISCTFERSLTKDIQVGTRVNGHCVITGKTRFGSIYGKLIDISKQ